MKHFRIASWMTAVMAVAVTATQLAGCAAAVIGGAAGAGALIMTAGRRSSETAEADGRIESQASQAIEKALEGRDHNVVVASYYHKVLLAGEVTSQADRARAQALAQGIPEVQGVINDLAVMPSSGALSRSQDAYITGKVKARLMGTNGVPAASIKVITERGTVYLMGRLTRQETQTTTQAVQQVAGVQRVARVIDFIAQPAMINSASSTYTSGGKSKAADVPAGSGVNDVSAAEAAAPTPGVETYPVTPQPAIDQAPPPVQVQPLPPVE